MKCYHLSFIFILLLFNATCGSGKQKDKQLKTPPREAMISLGKTNRSYKVSDNANMKWGVISNTKPLQRAEKQHQERKIIKKGEIRFKTQEIDATRKEVGRQVKALDGYVASEKLNNNDYRVEHILRVKVPSVHFDSLMHMITRYAQVVKHRKVTMRDVTDEFIDIQARLKNKRQLEARYQQILQKANTVEEMLKVERELNKLREDIESAEGRLKYLSNQVNYSEIKIRYFVPSSADFGFGYKFAEALEKGWDNFMGFIIAMVNIWPLLILAALIVFWIVRRRKKKRQRKEQE